MDPLLARHVAACNSARLPGERLIFALGPTPVGWVSPAAAEMLATGPAMEATGDRLTLTDAALLPALGRLLAERGFCPWRNEAFDVRAEPEGPVLATIDRGAIPVLGLLATGVHLNGLLRRGESYFLWVARRSDRRPLDPGKLDHLVAGGVPAGMTPEETLLKEAAEEAALPAALARQAVLAETLTYAMERPEGLRRDRLFCYDLLLPEDFTPHAADGEAAGFELWPLEQVRERVRHSDDFKFNVNLVLIGLFRRLGLV
jgi:8-oxo-dGTP pyrophosphatase MutT (NUDIX family)